MEGRTPHVPIPPFVSTSRYPTFLLRAVWCTGVVWELAVEGGGGVVGRGELLAISFVDLADSLLASPSLLICSPSTRHRPSFQASRFDSTNWRDHRRSGCESPRERARLRTKDPRWRGLWCFVIRSNNISSLAFLLIPLPVFSSSNFQTSPFSVAGRRTLKQRFFNTTFQSLTFPSHHHSLQWSSSPPTS